MPETTHWITFALVVLGLVLTPGPNMIYLVSRSICQGRTAGLISLSGVASGFLLYMLCATLGLTALLLAVPYAYDVLRFGGAAYLLYLAWGAVKPGGLSPFQVRDLPKDSNHRLFTMGLVTSLLNPKVAVFYLSLLPQFIDPARGDVMSQSLILGGTQITISVCGNALIAVTAGTVATFLARRPLWQSLQRRLMGVVLAGLALKLATEARR